MEHKLEEIQKSLHQMQNGCRMETHILYPGIELSFLTLQSDVLTLQHQALDRVMEINYCHTGRIGWKMKNGNSVYLGPGDYSLHTMKSCANSVMTLPNGYYEGITLCIDLNELSLHPPKLLKGTGITGEMMYDRFCGKADITSLAGNQETAPVFSAFYDQPENLRMAYWRIKALELLLFLSKLNVTQKEQLTQYQSEQVEVVRSIHEQLIRHLDQRFTIESLSKQYLMNPTTLKVLFKSVYGTSIAAHIKAHRMEEAARLLLESGNTIAQIARDVGYDNQSKFAEAFKEYYQVLPTEYRKFHINISPASN